MKLIILLTIAIIVTSLDKIILHDIFFSPITWAIIVVTLAFGGNTIFEKLNTEVKKYSEIP